jgi:two-component system, NtrC family, response regulator PilR
MMEAKLNTGTSHKRVLIVEENETLRQLLTVLLESKGIGIDSAADPTEATERIHECDYALILTDVTADPEGALSFLRTLRSRPSASNTFVIAFTGPDQEVTDPWLVGALIQKPFEISILSTLVRDCLGVIELPEGASPCPPADSTSTSDWDETGRFSLQ